MTSKKYFYIQLALFVLAIILIVAGTVAGNSALQDKSKKLSELKVESATIELQQSALIQAKKDIEKYDELDKIARSVVPQDKDQAKTVREIVALALQNNIPIKSISFETSKLGEAAAKRSASSAEGSSSTKAAEPGVSQVIPVTGISGVFMLPIQVESAGAVKYQDFLSFLESLEKNRRTAHVSAINLEPSDNGETLNFDLTLNAYVKP